MLPIRLLNPVVLPEDGAQFGFEKHKKNNLGIGSHDRRCYNHDMRKEEATEKDRGSKDSKAATKTDKKSDGDENESSGSEVELEPVRPKIRESEDTLRKRAAWFQKRTGGG